MRARSTHDKEQENLRHLLKRKIDIERQLSSISKNSASEASCDRARRKAILTIWQEEVEDMIEVQKIYVDKLYRIEQERKEENKHAKDITRIKDKYKIKFNKAKEEHIKKLEELYEKGSKRLNIFSE